MKLLMLLLSALFICEDFLFAQNDLTLVLAGDAIITRKLSVYDEPEFLDMIKFIRDADAAFVNLEMLLHNYESYPMHQSGGTYMRAEPAMAKEIAWAGFDLVSTANNHTGDYGVEAMKISLNHTSEAGLVHAGSGNSLAEAREARFLETKNGRIALIACSSTFPDHSRAGKSRDNIPARPGLNPIRYTTTQYLKSDQMESLQELAHEIAPTQSLNDSSFRFLRQRFTVSDSTYLFTSPNPEDMSEIGAVVRNASKLSDVTILSIHAHERDGNLENPAQFIRTFARKMIDEGADVVVGHGPHVLREIEIYKGKPILYSLGDFMFQNETLLRLPVENYERYQLQDNHHVSDFNNKRYKNDTEGFPARPKVWEAVLAKLHINKHKVNQISLHPITLGFGKSATERGRPMFAKESLGKKIIQDIMDLSNTQQTIVSYKNGIGLVKID